MRKRLRLAAVAVLVLLPAMARAQQQESAPPPATVDPRDTADRRPSLVEPDVLHPSLEHVQHGGMSRASRARSRHPELRVGATTAGIESNTLLIGASAQLRLSQGVYVLGSWTPRASGFGPGVSMKTFAVEKRLGGHVFQLNVSNSLGTSLSEMARGAANNRDWFLGFNLSRRFF